MNEIGFIPLRDKVLIKNVEAVTKTAGGLYLPEIAQERSAQGTVIAVGEGVRTEDGTLLPLSVRVGDEVLYGKYGGTSIQVDGGDYVILAEREIYGVLRR